MAIITVGVAGITGKFSRRLVSHLLKQPDVTIRGYCRDPSKVPEAISSSSQVTLFKGDALDKDAVSTFAKSCVVIVCCYLGDDKLMVDGQKLLIDACDEFDVPRYVASDWALDYTKLKLGELFPKDPMIHVKAYLETKKVQGSHTFRFWGSGDEVMEGTTYDNAAEFTAAVTVDEKATGVVKFLGGRATIHEIAASFEKIYGIKPTLQSHGSLDALYKIMYEKREKNPADIYGYMSLFYYYYWVNGQTFLGTELDNERYAEVKPIN
ncbi:hypothetical protein UA08_00803 [Talaromyces atroroseus]|uniref:NAD(P)-binding domain-containing protein n=1 Tax=Talaromyces atroroseus TaxID=1441469 RepID=A0A225AQT1_TALAT|nr:hypothetical protein UA08_00803 [Talaromyces atroroseus]OKL63972.1 hypothetical protein UA08_00803 [Talaromyces atroroseus]